MLHSEHGRSTVSGGGMDGVLGVGLLDEVEGWVHHRVQVLWIDQAESLVVKVGVVRVEVQLTLQVSITMLHHVGSRR